MVRTWRHESELNELVAKGAAKCVKVSGRNSFQPWRPVFEE